MSAPTIEMNETSHRMLQELVARTGQSAPEVLGNALNAYHRQVFFDRMNAGYAELRADAAEWSAHMAERNLFDASLPDGLEPNEQWTEDGRCLSPDDLQP